MLDGFEDLADIDAVKVALEEVFLLGKAHRLTWQTLVFCFVPI